MNMAAILAMRDMAAVTICMTGVVVLVLLGAFFMMAVLYRCSLVLCGPGRFCVVWLRSQKPRTHVRGFCVAG